MRLSRQHRFKADNINQFLLGRKRIFDIGSGPIGSPWWAQIDRGARITGIDTQFFPKKVPQFVSLYKLDATKIKDTINGNILEQYKPGIFHEFQKTPVFWQGSFDMVVANHVLEHVKDPLAVISGMAHLLAKGGIVYTGFPDGQNFTDTFYHLIHAEGGGHIQRLVKKQVLGCFLQHGFQLVSWAVWPDDWIWFEKLYDYQSRGLRYITKRDIRYLAQVFRKELTVKKGYYYGWEMVFQKK